MDADQLPESWRPQAPAAPDAPVEVEIPEPPGDDPAELAAWYFGSEPLVNAYRKVVLSVCKELVRAEYAAKDQKITDGRTDDLAHKHDRYLDFLRVHLERKAQWHREYMAQRGQP
jgi:hypothetical protein